MILVDTSIWIDHFRGTHARLKPLLLVGQVVMHPFVIGELALGHLRQRKVIVESLKDLPRALTASEEEVLTFIERHKLYGLGIGYVDIHLLTAARLNTAQIWTGDKRLHEVAIKLGLARD